MTKVCFIDNFDSFTYNLVEYVSHHTESVEVLRNTASLGEVQGIDPDAIVISPGPGHPKNERDVGVTPSVLTELSPHVPTLGICLGLEAAVYAYGGTIGHAPAPIHGKAFPINHDGTGVFRGLDSPLQGGRYHSLVATDIPDCFRVTASTKPSASGATARTHDDLVMGVRHRDHPIEGVQFHPESVLTELGHAIIRNFIEST